VSDIKTAVTSFRENGYVVFRSALEADLVDNFWDDVEFQIQNNMNLTMAEYGKIIKNAEIMGRLLTTQNTVLRIIDLEKHSEQIPAVMLSPVVTDFLMSYYGSAPSVLQTLTYKYSSQQGAHSDLYLVNPPTTGTKYNRQSLAAAWFACEEANKNNGALVIYPKSHLLDKKLYTDFDSYAAYVQYLEELCANNGIKPEIFEAKKGDILFWHGDFVHAGGAIESPNMTRKSLVVHYANISLTDDRFDVNLERHKYGNGYYFK